MESIKKNSLRIITLIALISTISIPLYIYYKNYGTSGNNKRPIPAYIPSGTYTFNSPIYYSCALGALIIDYTQFIFIDNGVTLMIQPAMPGDCFMSGGSATDGQIDVSCISPGTCAVTFSLVGTFTDNDTWEATFTVTFSGSCMDCTYQSWDIIGTRFDERDPIITDAPSNFTVEYGYMGVNISWTAADTNPNIYMIELQGTGIVAGPKLWSNGTEITYNIPDGLDVGEYVYKVNFTDDYGNYATDTVKLTVQELNTGGEEPVISFGIYYLVFLIIGIISLVIAQKGRKS